MIRVVCGCGRVFKAEDRHSGRQTRCPACGSDLIIGPPTASGSGSGEQRSIEELPSWWAMSAVTAPNAVLGPASADFDDNEGRKTTVLEGRPEIENGHPAGLRDDLRATAMPDDARRRPTRAFAGVLAGGAVLALIALGWARWSGPVPGHARDIRSAPADDAGRSRTPAVGDPARPAAIAVEARRPPHPPRRLHLLVPAYFYPKGAGLLQWRRLLDAADRVDVVAIVNPDSGPGAERNPDYAALVAEADARAARLVGYVNTQFAARPTSEVKADIDTWLRFYPRIDGFYLDQQPNDARHSAYIADIANHAREKLHGALVLSGPGALCDESYLARRAADIVCIFSNFEGFDIFTLPAHLTAYDPSHYAAFIYQVDSEDRMRSLIRDAIIKRVGSIYITDGKAPNPWSALPPYWDAEVQAVWQLQ